MESVRRLDEAEQKTGVILCICCEHLAGTTPADATLVIKKAPPQSLLAPLRTICENATAIAAIFRWIQERVQDVSSAEIRVWCCHECTTHESLRLNPGYGHTFTARCRDIERILASMYRQRLTRITRVIICYAGEMTAPAPEDGAVSGVRLAMRVQGGDLTYFDAPQTISD